MAYRNFLDMIMFVWGSTLERSLIRRLRLGSDACKMASLTIIPIEQSGVDSYAVL